VNGIAAQAPGAPSVTSLQVDNPQRKPQIQEVIMYDLEETFTHTLDSVLESIDVYPEEELLDDDDLSLLDDEEDDWYETEEF
jgi:hypothetical protein